MRKSLSMYDNFCIKESIEKQTIDREREGQDTVNRTIS